MYSLSLFLYHLSFNALFHLHSRMLSVFQAFLETQIFIYFNSQEIIMVCQMSGC